ncbi:MAG: dihydrofolate reductase, partial [Thermodesulfobacteriota bacterium]|nr:dihydrofolate reductase [Thermodesulfobacteriota bacterium]
MIVAMAKNRVIGNHGQLPWHLSADLERFKSLTMGHTLLMGRLTFESIGRPLSGRRTIIASRNPEYRVMGCEVVDSIEAGFELASGDAELFVCGGSDIYRQALPRVERIYLTELDIEVAGDSYFPLWSVNEFVQIH